MRVPKLLTAALFLLAGPFFAFPDLLPAAGRVVIVTVLTLAAVGLSLIVLNRWKPLRWGLWLLTRAMGCSWLCDISRGSA